MNTPAQQFTTEARRVTGDRAQRQRIHTALSNYEIKRDEKKALFQDWDGARQLAATIKWDAINHLDQHLDQLAQNL